MPRTRDWCFEVGNLLAILDCEADAFYDAVGHWLGTRRQVRGVRRRAKDDAYEHLLRILQGTDDLMKIVASERLARIRARIGYIMRWMERPEEDLWFGSPKDIRRNEQMLYEDARGIWGDVSLVSEEVRIECPAGLPAPIEAQEIVPTMGDRTAPEVPRLFFFVDPDWPKNAPGDTVGILAVDWHNPGLPSVEGWRGPEKESEDFARKSLRLIPPGTVMVDMGGFWEIFPPGITVIS
jgi:hypothetical protein